MGTELPCSLWLKSTDSFDSSSHEGGPRFPSGSLESSLLDSAVRVLVEHLSNLSSARFSIVILLSFSFKIIMVVVVICIWHTCMDTYMIWDTCKGQRTTLWCCSLFPRWGFRDFHAKYFIYWTIWESHSFFLTFKYFYLKTFLYGVFDHVSPSYQLLPEPSTFLPTQL